MFDPLSTAIGGAFNLFGGLINKSSQEEQRAKNEALQREFATSSIQMRVKDAEKAGIHPLYALGAPSISPAVSVQNDPLGSAISSMGQDISRAAMAAQSPGDKATTMLGGLAVERASLQNDLLRLQIQRLQAPGTGPGIPAATTDPSAIPNVDADRVKPDITKVELPSHGNPGIGAGVNTYVEYARTPDGGYMPMPSKAAKDRLEDMGYEPHLWTWHNRIAPYLGGVIQRMPPPFDPPSGGRWEFSHIKQAWYDIPPGPTPPSRSWRLP